MFVTCVVALHCVFILSPVTQGGLSLDLDGKIDLGPKWSYEYHLQSTNIPLINQSITRFNRQMPINSQGPRMIDIIIKNSNADPNLIKIGEAHFMIEEDKNNSSQKTETEGTKLTTPLVVPTAITKKPRIKKKRKGLTKTNSTTTTERPHKREKQKHKRKTKAKKNVTVTHKTTVPTKFYLSDEHTEPPVTKKVKKPKKTTPKTNVRQKQKFVTEMIIVEEFPAKDRTRSTSLDDINFDNIYINPRNVKDDEKIKELSRHIYEQSIKVLENIQDKMTNYEMKREVKHLMKVYEQKFGDFVRDTQDQTIKTRLGRKKVILNTVDTSNRILERLINYLIWKMDYKGISRSGASDNVLRNQLKNQKQLEDRHICHKLGLCRSQDSLPRFVSDIMSIIISADDMKVKQAANAFSEVLKETDLTQIMSEDNENKFHKTLDYYDQFGSFLLRPLFSIIKNIMNHKNRPIIIEGPVDSRVNRTMALLEILDILEQKLPADEKNVLFWNDMRNSFNDWKDGKRTDPKELVHSFIDHIMKPVSSLDSNELNSFHRNVESMFAKLI